MNRKVSIVVIALLLITQLMQGWIFTANVYAEELTTEHTLVEPLSEEVGVEPVTDGGEAASTLDSEASNESVDASEVHEASSESAEPIEMNEQGETDPTADNMDTANAAATEIKENLITDVQMYDQIPEYDGNGHITVKGNKIEDIRPSVKDEVAVVFEWGFADDTHAYTDGSTFTFRLPDKFSIGSQLKGVLDGGVGNYIVNPDGEITFIFNDAIRGAKLEGNFYVWIKFDESKLENGLKQQIDFSSVGQSSIPVHFANTAIDKLTKSGSANKNNFNSDEIVWTVDFNQGEKEIKNATLTDVFPADLELKGNIEIRELEVNIDGSVEEGNIVRTEPQFPINLGDIEKAYRVTYQTSVKAPVSEPFTNRVYENQVTLTLTADEAQHNETATGKVTVSFNEPLNKSGQNSAYDPVTQTITWKVQYNYNQQAIAQTNAWIEDHFDTTKYALVDGSVKVLQVDIDGSGKPVGTSPVDSKEYTLTGVDTGFDDGFKLQFNNNINKAYEIEYQTKSIDRVYTDTTVSNTVKMYDGTQKDGTRDIKEVIFGKSVQKEDFNKKEIEWKLVINRDLKDMTDIVITEQYAGRHMKLIPDSLQITGLNKDDFDLVTDPTDPAYKSGFSIRLKGGVTVSTLHEIIYTTSFDPTAGMPTNNEYRNTATLDWTEAGVPHSITKWAVVNPQSYTIENGNKKGEYSAQDKTITWIIDTNYNLYDIKDAIIKDTYTGNQTFVDGSLKVNELVLEGNNNVTGVGNEVLLNPGQFELNSDGKGFVLKLGQIGKTAYRIEYKTSLDGPYAVEGTYSNDATLNDGEGGPLRFQKKANVTPAHGGIYVKKTGKQEGTSDIASWTVQINPSQSHIAANSILTDTLSDNQILLADTLKLYTTNLPANNSGDVSIKAGLVDPEDYELLVKDNTFTITFNKALNTAFILEYKSFINADNGERIKNNVEFAGQSSSVTGEGNQAGIKVLLAGAGGGASSGVDKIRIIKKDDSGMPLEGVVFQIYNASGTTLLETLQPTDANGEVVTSRNYRFNDQTNGLPYKLKETSAPAGYLIDSAYGAATGKTIEFKDLATPFEIINHKIRQGFELTKVDAVDSNRKLKGAVFELYLNNGSDKELRATLTTDDNGRIARGDLVPGNYELVEVTAPEFYQLDATPIPFTIVPNQTQIITLSHANVQGADGKLVVTKVNAKDQSVLSGIEFELRNSTNTVIATKVTDINGVIEFDSLPYGPYTLVETKAEGFVIDKPETQVNITKPDTQLTIENKENDRSVTLIKFNADKTQHLQGAVFELRAKTALMDVDGNWKFDVVTGVDEATLTTNQQGQIVLKDLKPTTYQLVEIKAPAGYQLDQTPIEFEITNKQTEAVVVEKTNNVIPVPGVPSEPYNPGTPVETPTPVTPTPTPVTPTPTPVTPTPTPVNPVTPTPGIEVPGTVVIPGTSVPEPKPEPEIKPLTNPEPGETPSTPDDPTVDEDDDTTVANVGGTTGGTTPPGVTSSPEGTDVAGSGEGKNNRTEGMLPKTGEESKAGYTFTGALMILLGSAGYVYIRRRNRLNL